MTELVRAVAAVMLLFGSAGAAFAQAADPDALLAEARHVAAEQPERATAILLGIAADPESTDGQRVRGIRLGMEVLPLEQGNRAASALVLSTLRRNRAQPDAWQLAFRVRDRVIDGLDLVNGEPFLRSLIELYPDQLRFQYYLADLYLDAGRPELADAQCGEILRQVSDDTRARRIAAYIRELDGRVQEALDLYAQIHAISGELEPLVYRVRILIDPVRDYAGAEEALSRAFEAVEEAPAGRARNAVRAELEYEEARLAEEREARDRFLRIAVRQDRLLLVIVGAWIAGLGGGLVVLRRRGLV